MLLNPKKHVSGCSDEQSKEIMRKTINFFETKGKRKLKQDDHERVWYADFLEFVKKENIFHVYAKGLLHNDRLTKRPTLKSGPGSELSLWQNMRQTRGQDEAQSSRAL